MWGHWHLTIHLTGDSAAWITALATALTALVLLATALVVRGQLREAERTRLATLITDLTRRWDEPLLQSARLEFSLLETQELLQIVVLAYAIPRGPEDEIYLRLQALPNFFEYLGVLEADTKGVPLDLINVLWRGAILSTWRRWEPTIEWIRDRGGTRTPYASFEELARKIRALPEHRVSEAAEPTTRATDPAEHQRVRSSASPSRNASTDATHVSDISPFWVLGGLGAIGAISLFRRLRRHPSKKGRAR